jgi:hypothetical protein
LNRVTISWKSQFDHELENALAARYRGNEGMARVCARRAAGALIGHYLVQKGHAADKRSAYQTIKIFTGLPDVPNELKHSAALLLVKVTSERTLPVDVDLIAEVIRLAEKITHEISQTS